MKIFVVSLERAKERRARIKSHLDRLSIDYEIFDAVDGLRLSDEEMAANCNMAIVSKHPQWLTRGMIGCCLSHYRIYKKIVAENIPCACIIEDDASVSENLPSILTFIEMNTPPSTLTLLHYTSWNEIRLGKFKSMNVDRFGIYNIEENKGLNSTAGYVISREICRKLIEFLFPIHTGPDSWHEMTEANAIGKIEAVYPKPVNIVHSKSTIDYLNAKSLKMRISNLVDEYKIFPLVQLLKYKRQYAYSKMNKITTVS